MKKEESKKDEDQKKKPRYEPIEFVVDCPWCGGTGEYAGGMIECIRCSGTGRIIERR